MILIPKPQKISYREGAFVLVQRLEQWFMVSKEIWLQAGKEGKLSCISEIVFGYAGFLVGRIGKWLSRKLEIAT